MASEKDIVAEAREMAEDSRYDIQPSARGMIRALADEVERLRERFSVTCGNCGERYLGPRDDNRHGYNICAMSRCED